MHYLANREGDLRFALLSDWLDADTEHVAGDEELLATAAAGIDLLNERHGELQAAARGSCSSTESERGTSPRDAGWGGSANAASSRSSTRCSAARDDRLLDDRTTGIDSTDRCSLRRDPRRRHATAAWRGRPTGRHDRASAQPADFDAATGRVIAGLRHSAAAHHADASGRARRVALSAHLRRLRGHRPVRVRGLRRVSGPLPGGSFTGKGIYDVDAFEAALHDRVPENTLLSHDLFEGVFARAGLVTDIELFDEFPSNYLVSAARQQRWARGDWQLLPWILGQARDANGRRDRSSIPGIARWKMLDNLRRTLSAPLHGGDTRGGVDTAVGPRRRLWTAFVLAMVIVPAALPVLSASCRGARAYRSAVISAQ